MPEYPDITVYLEALEQRILGQSLEQIRFNSPFLLRSLEPPVATAVGKKVVALRRIGKRIAIGVENEVWLVLHLMIAGRLHWRKPAAKLGGRQMLAAFDFPNGALILTEAGTKKRASLHMAQGEAGLRALDPRWPGNLHRGTWPISPRADQRKPHLEANVNRPARLQRHWQCILRRDSPSRQTLARATHNEDDQCANRGAI